MEGLSVWNQYSLFLYLFDNVFYGLRQGQLASWGSFRHRTWSEWGTSSSSEPGRLLSSDWLLKSSDWRLWPGWLRGRSHAVWRDCWLENVVTPVRGVLILFMGNIASSTNLLSLCSPAESVVMTSPGKMIVTGRYLMLIVILITFKLLHSNTVRVRPTNTINTNNSDWA